MNWRDRETEKVFNAILEVTGMAKWDLQAKSQKREIVDLRKIFTWIIFSKWSLQSRDEEERAKHLYFNETHVSEYLGVDRTTILHYRRSNENLLETNKQFRALKRRIVSAYMGELNSDEAHLHTLYRRMGKLKRQIQKLEHKLTNDG